MRNYGQRKCVWCGKLFIAHSARAQSCGADHYRPCARCGQPLLVKESYVNYMKYGPRTCSECRKIAISESHKNRSDEAKEITQTKREATNLKKYGVANPLQRDDIKEKVHATIKDRYGVDNLSQSATIQEKIKENSLDKYGVTHYSQDPTIRANMLRGMKDKYGVEYAMQSEECKSRAKATNLERYGAENVLGSECIQEKIKHTCLDKYGVKYAAQAPEIIQKRTTTNMIKYGGPAYIFSPDYLKTTVVDSTKYDEYIKFKQDPKGYIVDHFSSSPTYHELADITGVSETTISYWIVQNKLYDAIKYNVSSMEQELVSELKQLDSTIQIIQHSRSIISPYEIDIYLPDYCVGIECNPTATHNSDIAFMYESNITPKRYHQLKSIAASSANIRLIHLFGYDWVNHRDIMISMIQNALNLTPNRSYARNLSVKVVPWMECKDFLNINHRQGATTCSVRLGLYDDKNRLMSVMTFGKIRKLSGQINNEDSWELSRFCSKLNYSIVGGASKLFKYFCETYMPHKVVSFSDVATTSGRLYANLGFKEVSRADPGYVWAHPDTEVYYNRVTCQKRNLKSLLHDDTLDIENHTEAEIMTAHGYGRVFDSGLIRWEYTQEL